MSSQTHQLPIDSGVVDGRKRWEAQRRGTPSVPFLRLAVVKRNQTWDCRRCRSISPVGRCCGLAGRIRAKLESYCQPVVTAWRNEEHKADLLYVALEPLARLLKISLQMVIGLVAVYLIVKNALDAGHNHIPNDLPDAGTTLKIIAGGLAIAAAAELAYTLFTKGPDEAVDPLMLGVASALMYQLANLSRLTTGVGLGTFFLVVSLGVLFAIRQAFITHKGLTWFQRGQRATSRDELAPEEEETPP